MTDCTLFCTPLGRTSVATGAGVGATYGGSQGALLGAQIGDVLGAISASFAVACFTAGTPLVVDLDGKSRSIEEIEVGDWVLARSEFDPDGQLELKRVEEKFVRTAVVMELTVRPLCRKELAGSMAGSDALSVRAGMTHAPENCSAIDELFADGELTNDIEEPVARTIKTTAEHPFFMPARQEFVAAGELEVGDLLISSDGQFIEVTSISSTAEVTTVYNLRVADYHTYFVGGAIWGWDVWVHNARYGKDFEDLGNGIQRRTYQITSSKTKGTYYRKLDYDTKTGEIDFSNYYLRDPNSKPAIVTITLTGNRKADFNAANSLRKMPQEDGYTWHHLDFDPRIGKGRMVLVKTDVHAAAGHSGGSAQYARHHGLKSYG